MTQSAPAHRPEAENLPTAPHQAHPPRPSPWAWLPVVLCVAAVITSWIIPEQVLGTPRLLLPVLNGILSVLTSLLVALLAARSLLVGGPPAALLLGAGMLTLGLASAISGIAIPVGRYDAAVTIYNIGVWLAGACNLLAALRLTLPVSWPKIRSPRTALYVGYGCVLLVMTFVTCMASTPWIPTFFVQGQEPTALRQVVLGTAIAEFLLAALLLRISRRQDASSFLHWYSLGLALIGTGLIGVVGMHHIDSLKVWVGRDTQYIGGVYLLVAVAIAMRGSRRWMIPLEVLRETHGRYMSLVEFSPDPILVHADGRYIFANPAAARLFGAASPRELVGRDVLGLVHPEFRAAVAQRIRASDRDRHGTPLTEVKVLQLDGQPKDVEVVGVWVEYEGRPAIQIVMRDITKRKRAEEALRASEQRLRLALDAARMVAWEWDVLADVISYSANASAVFGTTDGLLLRRADRAFSAIHPQDLPAHQQRVDEALSGQAGYVSQFRLRRPGMQEYFWVEDRARIVRDASGKTVHVFGIVADITDRKRTEQQLKDLNDTLERRVVARTAEAQQRAEQLRALAAQLTQAEQKERQRLATILHDHLQQLLVGAKFNLGVLRGQLETPEQKGSLKQVDDLLDESLDTSRSLTVDLCPPILQQGTMAQVLLWLSHWIHRKHGLVVMVQADEHARPQAEEVRVLLFQAVRELLFNVVKHAKVNQASVELTCRADGRVQAVVSDTGVGFDPSQPLDEQHAGSGFGLLAVRERVDWLGGRLSIDSAPGKGTRATVVLPMCPKTGQAKMAEPIAVGSAVSADTVAAAMSHRRVRVLLADDHEVMRNGLARLLQMQSWIEVVAQAADGRQAVEMALQLQPDVVVTDVNMPVLDGKEATRQILARLPHVKVIGLSMFAESDVAEAMKAAGAVHYLAKTSGPDALIAAIRAAKYPAG